MACRSILRAVASSGPTTERAKLAANAFGTANVNAIGSSSIAVATTPVSSPQDPIVLKSPSGTGRTGVDQAGHCALLFAGQLVPGLPGFICLVGSAQLLLPVVAERPGDLRCDQHLADRHEPGQLHLHGHGRPIDRARACSQAPPTKCRGRSPRRKPAVRHLPLWDGRHRKNLGRGRRRRQRLRQLPA